MFVAYLYLSPCIKPYLFSFSCSMFRIVYHGKNNVSQSPVAKRKRDKNFGVIVLHIVRKQQRNLFTLPKRPPCSILTNVKFKSYPKISTLIPTIQISYLVVACPTLIQNPLLTILIKIIILSKITVLYIMIVNQRILWIKVKNLVPTLTIIFVIVTMQNKKTCPHAR